MTNRLQNLINLVQIRLETGSIPPADLIKLEEGLATSWKDLVAYQNLQSIAHASGKISLEEAQLLYKLLGRENPIEEKWDNLSIAERVAVTKMMSELLDWKIKESPSAARPRKKATRKQGSKPMPGLGRMR